MALTTGVDLVELERVERAVARFGERFVARVYTEQEAARYAERPDELATRFAAKEAVSKALGVGMRHMSAHGIHWHDVEVLPDERGKPVLHLHGRARALAEEQGLREWSISLTHERMLAMAFVVAMG
ncbi:MAG TPA: holo-ACP synthase [Anaerolineae bacterium]|nr:holo-ACP synthase [Anaerolineae bacterium]